MSAPIRENVSEPPHPPTPSDDDLYRRRSRYYMFVDPLDLDPQFPPPPTNESYEKFFPIVVTRPDTRRTSGGKYDFRYYGEDGSGLRPLPNSISDIFELERLIALYRQELRLARSELPVSKSAIESMRTITISSDHIRSDSCCAVCKDPFALGCKVRKMPCKHIFHQDCILPWLSERNSCPVCRHVMRRVPRKATRKMSNGEETGGDNVDDREPVGLTIWWVLEAGSFVVGHFFRGDYRMPRENPYLMAVRRHAESYISQ